MLKSPEHKFDLLPCTIEGALNRFVTLVADPEGTYIFPLTNLRKLATGHDSEPATLSAHPHNHLPSGGFEYYQVFCAK